MAIDIHLKEFTGPLDLLLTIISEKKLEISDIAISEVTDQYLKYLETIDGEVNPVLLADFLVIATKLLFIKSKNLLPELDEAEDNETSLEEQLKLYKAFIDISQKIDDRWAKQISFFRIEPPKKADGFVSPKGVTKEVIHDKMKKLIIRLTPPKPIPQTQIDRVVSLKQKIIDLQQLVKKKKRWVFQELISEQKDKTEIIVSFLALLELVKQHSVSVDQKKHFGDIVINRST